jgi:aspartate/methionine/tyrosine aminotransferase
MNQNLERITPFIVMDVLEKANELESKGANVSHLEVGEPDFDVPDVITQAAIEAQLTGKTHYTHSLGDLALRQSISHFYKKEYNVDVDPQCILVTSGSSPAILMVLMMLCNAGDEVIMSNPGYSCYKSRK